MDEKVLIELVSELFDKKEYAELRKILIGIEPHDLAKLAERFDKKELPIIFRLLPKELAAEVFVEMEPDMQEDLISSFSDKELEAMLEELYIDDAVDIIEEMPANVVKRILSSTDSETRGFINEILKYPKDSAGSIMTVEYIRLDKAMTVADAFKRIRRVGVDKETIYTCYVTEPDKTLTGLVTVKHLLLADEDSIIDDIMQKNIIYVNTTDDKEHVAREMSKYDFLAIPVVDGENRLVGIVTVDDAIDVLQEESTEDIQKMAALTPTDKPYLRTSVFEIWFKRIPWLMMLMISATFTGTIISSFEDALSKMVILAVFIPMLMDTGGNSGGQAAATIIIGLSLGEISMSNILKVIWKEIRVALLCGITLAAVGFGKAIFIDKADVLTALVVCSTLIVTVVSAKLLGCTLPILAKRIGFDPAVMSSPIITTVVDVLSLLFYFGIATAILPQLQ
ncbi:MAG: magnesium transporter [Firmicutes bacterium HGW-Firmicutes-21]|nr:MAG: magnesium transporter [Firmicutes bacterium HGW-Firmicutes-21]